MTSNLKIIVVKKLRSPAGLIAGAFAVFGILWILFAERLLQAIAPGSAAQRLFQGYDRWLCMVISTVVIYVLLRCAIACMQELERERARSDDSFRKLVEHSLVGIYIIQDGRFTYANPKLEEIFGYSSGEIVGKTVTDLVAPQDAELVSENIRKCQSGEVQSIQYEFKGQKKDGSIIDVEVIGARAECGCKPAVVGTLLDHTRNKLLQREFLQAQKMEIVGRIAGGVAHDFNNMLTAIMGYAQLLLPSFDPKDERRLDIQEIDTTAKRAAALTHQLLAFSRRQMLEPKTFELNTQIAGLAKMLRRLIGEDIKLNMVLSSQNGIVHADPEQIGQALMNLVVNARDAMPHGGIITIETKDVSIAEPEIRPLKAGPYVMLAVSDTGCGMDFETKSHLFEPFFTTKDKEKGTGLGLSTVYGIISQSGGRISVHSELGQGTLFKILLPRISNMEEAGNEPPTPPSDVLAGTETVLLIEDETPLRRLASRILRQYGYKVLEAHEGKLAVDLASGERNRIDLILTDVVMPQMSGIEAVAEIRKTHPEARVVYMSGYTDEAIVNHGILRPGVNLIHKPFAPADLARKVRQILDADHDR